MQQFSGSSGRGGTRTPATRVDFFRISERRSRGEERREEKTILGPSVAEVGVVLTAGDVDGSERVTGPLVDACLERGWERIVA